MVALSPGRTSAPTLSMDGGGLPPNPKVSGSKVARVVLEPAQLGRGLGDAVKPWPRRVVTARLRSPPHVDCAAHHPSGQQPSAHRADRLCVRRRLAWPTPSDLPGRRPGSRVCRAFGRRASTPELLLVQAPVYSVLRWRLPWSSPCASSRRFRLAARHERGRSWWSWQSRSSQFEHTHRHLAGCTPSSNSRPQLLMFPASATAPHGCSEPSSPLSLYYRLPLHPLHKAIAFSFMAFLPLLTWAWIS